MDLQSRFKLFDCEPPAEQNQHLDDVVKLARTTYMEYLFAQALLLYRNDAAGSEDEIKAQSKAMKAIKITFKDIQGASGEQQQRCLLVNMLWMHPPVPSQARVALRQPSMNLVDHDADLCFLKAFP